MEDVGRLKVLKTSVVVTPEGELFIYELLTVTGSESKAMYSAWSIDNNKYPAISVRKQVFNRVEYLPRSIQRSVDPDFELDKKLDRRVILKALKGIQRYPMDVLTAEQFGADAEKIMHAA